MSKLVKTILYCLTFVILFLALFFLPVSPAKAQTVTLPPVYTVGDTIYASGTKTLSKLGIGSSGTCMSVSGGLPAWVSCLITEAGIEAVVDLQDLQGAVTDSQVPNNITVDLATSASDLTCTDCIGTTEIADSYVLNTGDTVTGDLFVNSLLQIGNGATSGGEWRLYEDSDNGINFLSFLAPSTIGSDRTCQLVNLAPFIPDSCVGNGTDDTGITSVSWGDIIGTLSSQTDLQTALDEKQTNLLSDGRFWLGDGSGFASEASLSGDVTMTNTGAVTIGADKILESMLKAVDSPADEEFLTYESTTGDFEWQAGSGGIPTQITVADTTDATSFCALFESATGDLAPKTDGGCLYDASNGTLSSTIFNTPTLTLTGTGTLNGLDVIDSTTETTIETAIDTLANLVSFQGFTVTLADAGADAILGWDDSANAYENLTQAEVLAVIGDSSDTAKGVVELTTTSEVNTGTDTTRAVTADALAGSYAGSKNVSVYAVAVGTALTTGDGKAYFVIPAELNGMNLVDAQATITTTSSSGDPQFDIARGRQANATTAHAYVDVLSTNITIDATEYDSANDATQRVIDTANDDVATGDLYRFDTDGIGTGSAGLFYRLTFRLP